MGSQWGTTLLHLGECRIIGGDCIPLSLLWWEVSQMRLQTVVSPEIKKVWPDQCCHFLLNVPSLCFETQREQAHRGPVSPKYSWTPNYTELSKFGIFKSVLKVTGNQWGEAGMGIMWHNRPYSHNIPFLSTSCSGLEASRYLGNVIGSGALRPLNSEWPHGHFAGGYIGCGITLCIGQIILQLPSWSASEKKMDSESLHALSAIFKAKQHIWWLISWF